MAIYSMEDGEGMMFAEETSAKPETVEPSESQEKPEQKKDKKPGLKIVK